MLPPVAEDQLAAEEFAADDEEHGHQLFAKAESKNEQQAWNKDRTQDLGDNPRKTRQALRAELQQGFNVSYVGKKRIQTLRNFGSCKVIWYGIPCGLSILERLCFAHHTTSRFASRARRLTMFTIPAARTLHPPVRMIRQSLQLQDDQHNVVSVTKKRSFLSIPETRRPGLTDSRSPVCLSHLGNKVSQGAPPPEHPRVLSLSFFYGGCLSGAWRTEANSARDLHVVRISVLR